MLQMVIEGSEVLSHCPEEEAKGSHPDPLELGVALLFFSDQLVSGRMSPLIGGHGISSNLANC